VRLFLLGEQGNNRHWRLRTVPVLNLAREELPVARGRKRLWTWLLHGVVIRSAIECATRHVCFSRARIWTPRAAKLQVQIAMEQNITGTD
jgi:hypothetical protein